MTSRCGSRAPPPGAAGGGGSATARPPPARDEGGVLAHAYQGHLSPTIALSPYKSRADRPAGTRVAALPTEPGALESLLEQIGAPAAFYAESLQGCGGQIVYPPGY